MERKVGGGPSKTKQKQIGRWGQDYLYVHSVKKITWFFEQQIELFLISCLAVTKSVSILSLVQHIKVFLGKGLDIIFSFNVFIWTCRYFYGHHVYLSVQKLWSFMLSLQKIIIFLFFHSPIFHSKFHKHRKTTLFERGWGAYM